MLIDTHCHVHDSSYPLDRDEVLKRAYGAGVGKIICVGTSEKSTSEAVEFAAQNDGVFAVAGVHPHNAKDGWVGVEKYVKDVVAVGEIGLDYFYTHSPKNTQIEALEWQIDMALRHDLPIVFHVREAFDDFWSVFDNFHGIRGVLHSFTDTKENMERGLANGLFIGMNGISTFTKDSEQREMFISIPLNRLLLETDAPYLTPMPFRGKVNEPAFVRNIAEYHARDRDVPLDEIVATTAANANALFAIQNK